METNPSPFIPSGTGNISPMQAEWRGLSPNAPVEVLGEGVVVKNNSMEELGLGTKAEVGCSSSPSVCQQRPRGTAGLEEGTGRGGGAGRQGRGAWGDLPGPQVLNCGALFSSPSLPPWDCLPPQTKRSKHRDFSSFRWRWKQSISCTKLVVRSAPNYGR